MVMWRYFSGRSKIYALQIKAMVVGAFFASSQEKDYFLQFSEILFHLDSMDHLCKALISCDLLSLKNLISPNQTNIIPLVERLEQYHIQTA